MRMSKKMRELSNQIQDKIKQIEAAVEANDKESAATAKAKLDDLRALYAAEEAAFEARRNFETDPEDDPKSEDKEKVTYDAKLFYKAVSHGNLTDAEKAVVAKAKADYSNRYSEGSAKDGGYTVPDDLSKEIFSAIESTESVRSLVHVENVNSAHGTRIFREGAAAKLYNTAEHSEIQEMQNKNYKTVGYAQKKFAGLLSISNELLEDSFVNFKSELVDYLSDAARNTENAQMFYGAGGEKHCQGMLSTAGAYKELDGSDLSIDFLRKAYLSLKAGYRTSAKWVMNSLAFAQVSNLKFEDGRSCIQPDPRNKDTFVLFGFPISIFDTVETDDENKTVIAFGDFKRAYRMFARRDFGISFTDIGAGAFETDSIKAKGTERFDGKIFDREALVIIRNVSVTPLEETTADELTGEINEATLKNLTKAQLAELASDLGVEGVSTEQTKDAMVAAIIAAQGE